jgi:hypothetical protein
MINFDVMSAFEKMFLQKTRVKRKSVPCPPKVSIFQVLIVETGFRISRTRF